MNGGVIIGLAGLVGAICLLVFGIPLLLGMGWTFSFALLVSVLGGLGVLASIVVMVIG